MDDPGRTAWQGLLTTLAGHETLWLSLALGSGLLFLASLLALPWLVAQIPADYFHHRREPVYAGLAAHPLLRWLLHLLRNLLGVLLVAAGVAMLFLPGQGLLTLLLGLMVMHFPGKYRLEQWLIARPGVLGSVNWLRARRGRPPLLPP